ncbi:hypothetical protein BC830DRAFT_1108527 [Chytriomyces sp. MP71]|nr:hypothetical protein BC830DRAFT_1108527 [Chytriomyces sp. MP71]
MADSREPAPANANEIEAATVRASETNNATEAGVERQSKVGATSVAVDKVPEDQVCVRLLLVSGLKTDLLLAPKDSVEDLKNRIFNNWPCDWTGERPDSPANLRVLLRGKFLEPTLTLADAKIPVGQTTTCHLLIKNGALDSPAAGTPGTAPKEEPGVGGEGCRCSIL